MSLRKAITGAVMASMLTVSSLACADPVGGAMPVVASADSDQDSFGGEIPPLLAALLVLDLGLSLAALIEATRSGG